MPGPPGRGGGGALWPALWLRALLLPSLLLLWPQGEHRGLPAGSLLLQEPPLRPRLSVSLPVLWGGAGQWGAGLHQHPPVLRSPGGITVITVIAVISPDGLIFTFQEQGGAEAGCRTVCRKCGEEWGRPAGKCFKKDHNTLSQQNINI